jgi:hypothetical protein
MSAMTKVGFSAPDDVKKGALYGALLGAAYSIFIKKGRGRSMKSIAKFAAIGGAVGAGGGYILPHIR